MQARYYDPVMGRFLSVDPVGYSDATDTGMFNRFSYTLNNPVNFTDPDGRCVWDICIVEAIAAVAVVACWFLCDDITDNDNEIWSDTVGTSAAEGISEIIDGISNSDNESKNGDKSDSDKGKDKITGGKKPKDGEREIDNTGDGRAVEDVLEDAAGAAGVEVGSTSDGKPTVQFPDGSRATGYPESKGSGKPSIVVHTPKGRVKVKTREDHFKTPPKAK
jgi:uncharacterized protein RhaS with RHS repeats